MVRVVTDYLEKTIQQYANKVAYVDINRSITFFKLQDEAYRVASYFIRNKVKKMPVLIFMDKSVSCISSFMGVAYSGNFYSPIDTKMPQARIEKIVSTLKPKVIITNQEHIEQIKVLAKDCNIVTFEELMNEQKNDNLIHKVRNEIIDTDILYVLFTSGSTGIPKGVIINHRAVVDFIEWISDCYHFDGNTVFANQAQLYFDLSIQDVFAPIRNGSTTVLIPNRYFSAPTRVWKMMVDNNVDTIVWIPSMLSMFANLDFLKNAQRLHLRNVLFCGEVMPTKQLNYWINKYPDAVYANLYGPTECTEACTYYNIKRKFGDNEVLPIGIPCENTSAIIVDENDRVITDPYCIGELCIRGTSLSMGYYGNKEKTEESFVQDPSQNEYRELVYRTGDLVKYNNQQELVYVGRKDFQIKKHGFRIELGEIEAVFSSISTIDYCCCLFKKEEEKLILIYTGDTNEDILIKQATECLQDYMRPDEYIKCDNMLFNLNGKIDRKALQEKYL